MAAPKMKILAKRFLLQIQDVYNEDPGNGNVLPGNLVRSIDELNTYLGQAMNDYFHQVWAAAKGRQDFINKFPDLFGRTAAAVPFGVGVTTLDFSSLGSPYHNIYDVLDSVGPTAGQIIEAWNSVYLADALAGNDPFYIGTSARPGMIFMDPILYLFPTNLTATVAFNFILNYIKLPVSPSTGEYFDVNGSEDIPFSIDHIKAIADIATKLYDVDDDKEDAS